MLSGYSNVTLNIEDIIIKPKDYDDTCCDYLHFHVLDQ